MFDKLFQYFTLNNKASLPGVGSFSVEQVPARLDFINKTLYAPSPVIRFSSGFAEADKNFYNYLSGGWDNNEMANIREFNDLVFNIKHSLSYDSEMQLPNFGVLKKDASDNYSFEQNFSINDFFPPVNAERVMRTGAKHYVKTGDSEYTSTQMHELLAEQKSVKDNWWLYALILTGIGLAAMAYYYFMYNN